MLAPGEAGLRQFLDIGTGMPASSNIHEVAQSVAPEGPAQMWAGVALKP